jgi:hypothetical protein
MTAPAITRSWTEAEVREALTRSIGRGYVDMDDTNLMLRVVIDSDVARTRFLWDEDYTNRDDDHPGTLWADLSPDETRELREAMSDVLHEVEREATAMLLERAVAAALAFQERHPDIPRGHYPLDPAA